MVVRSMPDKSVYKALSLIKRRLWFIKKCWPVESVELRDSVSFKWLKWVLSRFNLCCIVLKTIKASSPICRDFEIHCHWSIPKQKHGEEEFCTKTCNAFNLRGKTETMHGILMWNTCDQHTSSRVVAILIWETERTRSGCSLWKT